MEKIVSTSKLVDGYKKAFIDSTLESDPEYLPLLISNRKGRKVLTAIEKEMKNCSDLFLSVAFITMGGIAPLLGVLKDLETKGIKGRVLTTDYLMFSDPRALDRLSGLSNLDVRIFKTAENNVGFHTKGYMFHQDGVLRIIVGSSNLTQSAITQNYEWNTRIVTTVRGQYAQDIEEEFCALWNSSVCYADYKKEYEDLYYRNTKERHDLKNLVRHLDLNYLQVLQPNQMQKQFILSIEKILQKGGRRALLISATGTGKTYASAFAIRKLFASETFNSKKVLFISHRDQINRQALKSYKRVFGPEVAMNLLSGTQNDIHKARSAQFLFSTVNMMAKENIYKQFSPEEFSVIILDECHRSGAPSYQRIIDYFKPNLLLGMSASPERTDNFDVFSLFDHNIACEIRLQQALENDLLCPFHYFGITDLEIDGELTEIARFSQLTSDRRIEYIIEKAEYYGYSGNRVKGLIFCSRKEEAKELSRKFNETGKYKTIMLCGDHSQEERENAIERLVSDDSNDRLDYIFTVDIFNEGVDVPEINQVILLRPTESPIIFVQQLGRGLRKAEGKEFVIVLDFIGNYRNNYMIPIALSGDRSGNKDNIRRSLMEGNNIIKGASTIYFDEISRNRIYKSIDSADLNQIQVLKKEYQNLKFKLGRIPHIMEFDELGELDPIRIIEKCGSYQNFLRKYDSDYNRQYTEEQYGILEFVSRMFASGMRIHELAFLKSSINSDGVSIDDFARILEEIYNVRMDVFSLESLCNTLSNKFFRGVEISPDLIVLEKKLLMPSTALRNSLMDEIFRDEFEELIDFGIYRFRRDYASNYNGTLFCLYKKYTYREVCWLLNWEKEEVSLNIGGYKFDKRTKTYPIFINYEKTDDIAVTTRYEDRFEDRSHLIAISKSKRTLSSEDVVNAVQSKERGITMPLFVRKNKDDKMSKEFYFLGTVTYDNYVEEFTMPGTDNVHAVEIRYRLDTPVEPNLYEYLTNKMI